VLDGFAQLVDRDVVVQGSAHRLIALAGVRVDHKGHVAGALPIRSALTVKGRPGRIVVAGLIQPWRAGFWLYLSATLQDNEQDRASKGCVKAFLHASKPSVA
jgi:hypothetical protein